MTLRHVLLLVHLTAFLQADDTTMLRYITHEDLNAIDIPVLH